MKIKSIEELVDKLDADLGWRKKELSYLFSKASQKSNIHKDTEIRVTLAFMYAHWEGYIKNACKIYLIYIKSQKERFVDLRSNFLAIKYFNKINQDDHSFKYYHSVLNDIINSQNIKVDFSENNIIKANSNLTSTVLKSLLSIIVLDENMFELKNKLIDEKLVNYRNKIVHGEYMNYRFEDAEELKNNVFNMLEEFKERLYSAAYNKEYRK
jgi:hypothetical protein